MAANRQGERGTAQHHGVSQGRRYHVLDHVGLTGSLQEFPSWPDKIRVRLPCLPVGHVDLTVALARRRSVDHVVFRAMLSEVLQRVSLHKTEGVSRLWPIIDANNLEAGAEVPHSAPSLSRKQIKQSRFHLVWSSISLWCGSSGASDWNVSCVLSPRRRVAARVGAVRYFGNCAAASTSMSTSPFFTWVMIMRTSTTRGFSSLPRSSKSAAALASSPLMATPAAPPSKSPMVSRVKTWFMSFLSGLRRFLSNFPDAIRQRPPWPQSV